MPGSSGGGFSHILTYKGLQIFSYQGSCQGPEDTYWPCPASSNHCFTWPRSPISIQPEAVRPYPSAVVGEPLYNPVSEPISFCFWMVHGLVFWGLPMDPITNPGSPTASTPLELNHPGEPWPHCVPLSCPIPMGHEHTDFMVFSMNCLSLLLGRIASAVLK